MSHSSLYGINKDFYGEEIAVYKNSWWFSPIVWSVLIEKYMYHKFSMFRNNTGWEILNTKLNNSEIPCDRVLWELSNQQIFKSSDKEFVFECIEKFLLKNDKYDVNDNVPILKREHIQDRFREIADDIKNNDYEYFVFKNTSVDDAVENWFWDYEHDKKIPLNNPKAEFVIIKDGDIRDFILAEEIMNRG